MLSTQPGPPRLHTEWIHAYPGTYSHRELGGGGGEVGEPVRRLEGRYFTRGVENGTATKRSITQRLRHKT